MNYLLEMVNGIDDKMNRIITSALRFIGLVKVSEIPYQAHCVAFSKQPQRSNKQLRPVKKQDEYINLNPYSGRSCGFPYTGIGDRYY